MQPLEHRLLSDETAPGLPGTGRRRGDRHPLPGRRVGSAEKKEKLKSIIHPLLKQTTETAPGGVSLVVPQPNINATVAQNILLSVEYFCRGIATIEWKHVSSWGTTKIVEWKSGNYVNISTVYKDRVTTFENGSIQLLNVGMRDAGYYFITVTEEYGTNTYGTIIVNVYEIIYEDLHFVAVLFAFLAAVSAILICFMWLCNKSLHLFQKKTTNKLTASTTEEIELETIEC
ncbi:V-set and transmembrane domain-containing protein 5 isoform X1 [Falco biarmicus]|uniref:V-set and transmembrane domain-containing protein 5 isoform X1 n=1 Tax=Falco cherrug TaxID=345164 RepID=UPI002478ED62|nr:V-set and transmembrane domain-containing protein 5 isoform X1 [Falco cherrug]XP_055658252.1 V-set and transmembrane domain-containing protein 5 isoform X1 [Falco peregrinus]XP_056184445.1 V-set and transmembrane domain-containing protein 5 isoform X1 [Falco biarmicus]